MKKSADFKNILLYREPVDMRKQSNGLAMIVEQSMQKNPFGDGCLFVFNNRKRDIIKSIYFDKAGFCLWCKRLDQGKFPWPRGPGEKSLTIAAEDLDLVFDGVDVFKRHPKLEFDSLD